MRDAGIGRLLAASLHQAIAELLPQRLEFYEGWLSPEGFRNGRVDLAGIRAVLSFLREEEGAYDAVVRRAGSCAAAWSLSSMSSRRRACLRALPAWLRIRAVCRLARRLGLESYRETRITSRWRRGLGRLVVARSVFCDIRGRVGAPLCGYYAGALEHLLEAFSLPATVQIAQCHGTGGQTCVVEVNPGLTTSRRTLAIALLLPILGILGASGAAAQPVKPVAAVTGRILVVPFENGNRDLRLHWLSEASAVLLTDALHEQGVQAISRDERLRAFERLQVPPLASLSLATVIRVAQLVGAAAVITGTVGYNDDTLSVTARCVRLETGRMDPPARERGPLADLFGTFRRLGLDLLPSAPLGAPGVGAPPPPASPGPPLAAFEQYMKGLVAETPSAQITALEAALHVYPTYDEARIALWYAHTSGGNAAMALKIAAAVPAGSRFSTQARFLVSLSQTGLRQYADALTTLAGLLKESTSGVVLNNLGVVQMRMAGASAEGGGRPAWYFSQACELDPGDQDFVFNLGYAYWIDKDAPAATYWLREAVRLDPADAAAHAVLSEALQATGATAEAAREQELAQRLSSAYGNLGKRAPEGQWTLRGLERLRETLGPPRAERVDTAIEAGGQREQRELATIYLDRGRRLFAQELDREAASELGRALYLSPYQAEAHLLLGRIYLRTGRLRDAVNALKISIWSEETAEAHVALAEAYVQAKDDAQARGEVQRALALDPASASARQLLGRLDPPRQEPLPL